MTASPRHPGNLDPDPIRPLPAVLALLALAVLLIVLGGCHSVEPRPRTGTQTVEVAIPVPMPCPDPPAVEIPERPRLPIEDLVPESTEADVVKAWVATARLLLTDNIALRLVLQSLHNGPEPPGHE